MQQVTDLTSVVSGTITLKTIMSLKATNSGQSQGIFAFEVPVSPVASQLSMTGTNAITQLNNLIAKYGIGDQLTSELGLSVLTITTNSTTTLGNFFNKLPDDAEGLTNVQPTSMIFAAPVLSGFNTQVAYIQQISVEAQMVLTSDESGQTVVNSLQSALLSLLGIQSIASTVNVSNSLYAETISAPALSLDQFLSKVNAPTSTPLLNYSAYGVEALSDTTTEPFAFEVTASGVAANSNYSDTYKIAPTSDQITPATSVISIYPTPDMLLGVIEAFNGQRQTTLEAAAKYVASHSYKDVENFVPSRAGELPDLFNSGGVTSGQMEMTLDNTNSDQTSWEQIFLQFIRGIRANFPEQFQQNQTDWLVYSTGLTQVSYVTHNGYYYADGFKVLIVIMPVVANPEAISLAVPSTSGYSAGLVPNFVIKALWLGLSAIVIGSALASALNIIGWGIAGFFKGVSSGAKAVGMTPGAILVIIVAFVILVYFFLHPGEGGEGH